MTSVRFPSGIMTTPTHLNSGLLIWLFLLMVVIMIEWLWFYFEHPPAESSTPFAQVFLGGGALSQLSTSDFLMYFYLFVSFRLILKWLRKLTNECFPTWLLAQIAWLAGCTHIYSIFFWNMGVPTKRFFFQVFLTKTGASPCTGVPVCIYVILLILSTVDI